MKLRIILASILLTVTSFVLSQVKTNSVYTSYIDRYKDMAVEQMLKHKIPASITLAQGLLESGAGRSTLAVQGNNHFGIKCHTWTGKKMYRDDDKRNDCFRVYDNVRQSYEDHSTFLQQPRYRSLFSLSITDYKGWARGLKSCGYATNPNYANSLIDIIEAYKLYQYDHASSAPTTKPSTHSPYANDQYTVFANNKNYYVKARRGDTFRTISKTMGVSERKLAKYNERNKKTVLSEGDIVYLKKKRTKADKKYKKTTHVIRAGQSMYDISQMYGIRLKSLYKKNKLTLDYTPHVGDRLKVY